MHRTVQGTAIDDTIEPSIPGVPRAITAGLRLAALALVLSGSPVSAQSPGWTSYSIPETGASVDFPSAIFAEAAGKAEGYGQRFRTSDGRADFTIQSLPNDGGSPEAFLQKMNPPARIVYKRITRNFFVVSSFKGDKIWYDRCNFSSRFINCVLINYPASEKRQWDGIVTRISNTLAGS